MQEVALVLWIIPLFSSCVLSSHLHVSPLMDHVCTKDHKSISSTVMLIKLELLDCITNFSRGWTQHSGLQELLELAVPPYECSCLSVATLYYILFLTWVYIPMLPGLISLGRYWQIAHNTPSVFNFIAHRSRNRPHRPFSATLTTESCCTDARRYWIYITKCCNRLISVMYICLQDTTKINSAQNI